MKLVRFGEAGAEKPGILIDSGRRKDCSAFFADWDREFFLDDGMEVLRKLRLEKGETLPDVPKSTRWGAPVARPGKIVAVGLNFSDHAKESGMEPPKEPVLFMKAANSVCGPYDDILMPRGSEKTDYEVEICIVIGKDARYLSSPAESADYIAGFTIANDVSERSYQLERGGLWDKGKSADTFCPLGPFLATAEDLPGTGSLVMTTDVNGERRQDGSSRTMVFPVDHLVWYISQFMTLEAGDIIPTGTPPGVGMGMKPPRYLREGDVVEMSVEGLGKQRHVLRKA
jgi:2,4-didehydro-3-deoxy-L-rhamnonate hydrolase